ncbi:hypothetical protein [Psychroserpens sp. SPM9]|uniref:hypothetical protein n=1 Tax=Psychroserpens sp. SPM9 TaxID=2975598 RepID=UPI0021A3E8BF|nr:hypothetical protein [Psychroserpens sp. SPM9]MDG5492125.1 hypothetical protein [Psychroserpens sp. SPM9]
MRLYATLLLFISIFLVHAQQPKMYFDMQLSKHLKAYKTQSEVAIENNDKAHAEFLFDSLFNNHLKLSYISEMTLNKVNGGQLNTADVDHAFLLITKSAWEQIDEKEIEAINRMSKMYKGQVDIVVLFWTSRSIAKKRGSDFSSLVTVTYVDERDNNANHIIKPYKHSFGAPTCFFISENKQLLDIDRKFTANLNLEDSELAFESAHQQIKKLILFNDEATNEGIITTLN